MTLNFQLQQAPLAFGLAEGVDPHQAPFGTLMTAENVRWTRSGRVEKRNGFTFLSSLGSTAVRIFARGAELSAIDTVGTVFSYSTGSSSWHPHYAPAPMFTVARSTAWDTVQGSKAGDVCVSSDGTITYAWVTGSPAAGFFSGGVVYFRQTDLSGNEVTPATLVYDSGASSTNVVVRAVASGTTVKLVWVDSGNLRTYDVTSGTTTTLKTDVFATTSVGPFDAQTAGPNLCIVYYNGTSIQVLYYTFAATPVNVTTTGFATADIIGLLAIDVTVGENLYVVYARAGTQEAKAVIYSATTTTPAVVTAAFTLESPIPGGLNQVGVARLTPTSAIAVWYSYGTNGGTVHQTGDLRYCAIGPSAPIQGGKHHASGVAPASKPFVINGSPYIFATNNIGDMGLTNGDTFMLAIPAPKFNGVTQPPPFETAHVEVLLGGQFSSGGITSVPSYGGAYFAVVPFVSSAGTFRIRQGGRLVKVTPATFVDTALRPVRYGPEVYFSGSTVSVYDGDNLVPGWAAFPPYLSTNSSSPTTGGTLSAGVYVVNAYIERRNFAGVLHRGPTAISKLFTTTGATSSISLVLTPVWVGSSMDGQTYGRDILVPIYVSQVGQSIPQRYTGDPVTNMVYNTYGTTTDIATTIAAPVIATAPAIYTASGELDDYQPPSSLYLTEHQNRLWSVGPDGTTVWFSKDATVNPGVAPGFNPGLTLSFNDTIVALQTLDSALLAFTSTGLYAIQGDGPAPNGQGATYQAVKVQTDVGCSNPRSVVSTPDGVMFQSARGIYLVDRGLQVSFIGKPVQSQTNAASVTTAVLVARFSEVRFSLNSGVSVVYNYVEKQWSTAKYSTTSAVYGRVILDACMWNGAYTALFEDGDIGYEDAASYLDSGSYVPMTLETCWNNAAGPLAYQSVRNFSCEGIANTNHSLTVSVGFDNEPTYAQSVAFAAGTPVTTIGPLESCDVSIGTRRKCQSIRFKIQDASPTGGFAVGTGQGPSFDSIGVEVGIKQGFRAKPFGKTG